jgi:DNA-binding transcriptional MerR regulator
MTTATLTLKDICAHFNVTPRTVRYYEQIELISPLRSGRTRIYRQREVARMTLILRGRRFGFSLEEIRQWLDLYHAKGEAAQMTAFLEGAGSRVDALLAARRALDEDIAALKALVSTARQTLLIAA